MGSMACNRNIFTVLSYSYSQFFPTEYLTWGRTIYEQSIETKEDAIFRLRAGLRNSWKEGTNLQGYLFIWTPPEFEPDASEGLAIISYYGGMTCKSSHHRCYVSTVRGKIWDVTTISELLKHAQTNEISGAFPEKPRELFKKFPPFRNPEAHQCFHRCLSHHPSLTSWIQSRHSHIIALSSVLILSSHE
jgi:hypothetical protein